jgi:cytochrome P450
LTNVAPPQRKIPRIVLTDPEVLRDPIGVYGRVREESPLIRVLALGLTPRWALTRFADIRAMMADRRFGVTAESILTPDVPESARPHLHAVLVDEEGHRRLRKAMARTFTARRAADHRPRIEAIVDGLLDDLAHRAADDPVDLLRHFAQPLPIDATCDFLGIPQSDFVRWREYPVEVGSGEIERFEAVVPAILEDARAAIAYRRAEPGDDVISILTRAEGENGDLLSEIELEALVWITVQASSTVTDFLGNAIVALLTHPEQLRALRDDPGLMPSAIEELVRWSGLHVLSTPRYALEDVELCGVVIREGDPIVGAFAAANRDPRVFDDPDRLDLGRRPAGSPAHLGFAHGPHGCAGNALGRVVIDVALSRLFDRFPALALAVDPEELERVPDPEAWRLESLPVTL